ncbi:MAG: DUF3667 domain-containing protein [Bacteroidota bacterium]
MDKCLNCHHPLPESATFCPNCGQKTTDGRISLREFMHNFVDNVFNLDSRIFKTMSLLFIPGKLTLEYFKGKHKTYYHPIRLYLVMSLVFFAILSTQDSSTDYLDIDFEDDNGSIFQRAEQSKNFKTFDANLDSIGQLLAAAYPDQPYQIIVDSLQKRLPTYEFMETDSIFLQMAVGERVKISTLDLLTMETDQILEQYQVDNFFQKIALKQGVRFAKNQELFARQISSNLPLMLLIMMPFLALFMKLLYIRNKRYYVEHLVFNFHHHAMAFSVFAVVLLLPAEVLEPAIPFCILAVFAFFFFAMLTYYQQGIFKTFIKFLIFNFFYLFSFIVALTFTLVISFLFF